MPIGSRIVRPNFWLHAPEKDMRVDSEVPAMSDASLVGSDASIISPFVVKLFAALDSHGVVWAVMRGWERLPEWTRYDIDIQVKKRDLRRSAEIACQCAKQAGWIVYGRLKFQLMDSVWMLHDGEDGQSYLRLDFEAGFSFRGVERVSFDKYLERREKTENGIWHLSIGHAGANVCLKELIANGTIDREARQRQILEGCEKSDFAETVEDVVGKGEVAEKIIAAARSGDWAGLAACAPALQKHYFVFSVKSCLQMARYCWELAWRQVCPFMHCFIVLIGPDGCGKTTIGDGLVERFEHRPFNSFLRIHMNFGMPRLSGIKVFLGRLIGRSVKVDSGPKPGTRHMGMHPPHSALRSMIYIMYYGIGMIFGRLRLLRWRAFGGMIIADRYYYDYYYMRGYMNCPRWFIRLFEVFAPKPDMIFILERPAEAIYAQKPELTIEEITRQQEVIRKWFGSRPMTRVIDASKGVESTKRLVNREVELWLRRKGGAE